MKYIKNTSKIILSTLIYMHCYGMDPNNSDSKSQTLQIPGYEQQILPNERGNLTNLDSQSIFVGFGKLDILKRIYDKDNSIFDEISNPNGDNYLHIAVGWEDLEIVKFVFEKKKPLLLKENNFKINPFHLAILHSNFEIFKYLYNCNKKILNTVDKDKNNALHMAANSGNLEIFKFLYDLNIPHLKKPNRYLLNSIQIAAQKNNLDIVKFLYEKDNTIIRVKDSTLRNILHLAAYGGHKETVDHLIEICPELLNEKDILGSLPYRYAQENKHIDVAKMMIQARLKLATTPTRATNLITPMKMVNLERQGTNIETLSMPALLELKKSVQEQKRQKQKNVHEAKELLNKTRNKLLESQEKLQEAQKNALEIQKKYVVENPISSRLNNKRSEAETVLAASIPSQPLENPVLAIAQENQIYTRMGLKKTNVEGVKAIYEKTLVKGEIYEANPNKEKMITHILKHQSNSTTDAKKEIPQIVFSDAERFANENTSLTLFDPPKEKPKRKIRIENPLKKLSKKAEDWKARQVETAEDKTARKMLRNQRKIIDSNPEGRTFETSSVSQSFGDFKSHFSITDSESQSTKSLISESEGGLDGINLEMKLSYPQLFRLLKKENAQNISEVKFKSSNIIRATLTLMQKLRFIDGTIGTANIHVTRKNSTDAFVSHITHGSGKYDKWYHNPAIVVNFFDFIAKCDPIIAEYLESIFEAKHISKDIPRINDEKIPTDNAPNEAGED